MKEKLCNVCIYKGVRETSLGGAGAGGFILKFY